MYDLNRYELTQEMIGHVTQTIKEEVSGLLVSYLLVLVMCCLTVAAMFLVRYLVAATVRLQHRDPVTSVK